MIDRGRRIRQALLTVLTYAAALLFITAVVFPFYWIVITSVKTPRSITSIPPDFFPKEFYFGFYVRVFTAFRMAEYIVNSMIVALITTSVCIVTGGLAAYSLARINIKGKKLILLTILGVSMFPSISILGPLFLLLRTFGLLNTRVGLVLPYVSFMLPISVWVLTNFFRDIPLTLEEAAEMDGCTPVQALVKIIVPLAIPGVFVMAILNFVASWNEFLIAFTLTTSSAAQTVPVGIMLIQGEYEFPWGEMSAASVSITVPLIVMILILQRRVIQGLTAGAIKG